jgi:hypothetical protein
LRKYVAFSESLPIEESPLRSKSLMAAAVATGAKIGLSAGGATPFVFWLIGDNWNSRGKIVDAGQGST